MGFEFNESEIPGLYVITPKVHVDIRGGNYKLLERELFEEHSLDCEFNETMIALNKESGTIRGFHYQRPPYSQIKLCYCISGGWLNYSIDLRKGSPTYGKVVVFDMSVENHNILYIPCGIANSHFVTRDNTLVLYQLGSKYMPEYEGGVRWDSVGLDLGNINPIISERDMELPTFDAFESPFIYGENC